MATIKPNYASVPKIQIPLFLDADDYSPQAVMKRFTLQQSMAERAGGKGFRNAPSSKHHPMLKSSKPTTRMERLAEMLIPHIEAEDADNVRAAFSAGKRAK